MSPPEHIDLRVASPNLSSASPLVPEPAQHSLDPPPPPSCSPLPFRMPRPRSSRLREPHRGRFQFQKHALCTRFLPAATLTAQGRMASARLIARALRVLPFGQLSTEEASVRTACHATDGTPHESVLSINTKPNSVLLHVRRLSSAKWTWAARVLLDFRHSLSPAVRPAQAPSTGRPSSSHSDSITPFRAPEPLDLPFRNQSGRTRLQPYGEPYHNVLIPVHVRTSPPTFDIFRPLMPTVHPLKATCPWPQLPN
ncbi:hypothetical protein DENSPDRAFT_667860 [Dentipellis sp. KUC8613]|nr:hypothetical protein DENSPDRAFT_667860 [Dentipellis sp. KUC8613]